MIRGLTLCCLLALPACPTVSDDLPGHLCQVTVETILDSCAPLRTVGDGGVQWLGRREDGGLAFTVFDQVKYGPPRAGEPILGVSRDQIPPIDGGTAQFGTEVACQALVGGWSEVDGGLQLNQQWPGLTTCPSVPDYAPQQPCIAVRRLVFEPLSECPQRCVVLSNDGARCDC